MLAINAKGFLEGDGPLTYRLSPSPFKNERPLGMPIDLLVLHFISLPPGVFEGDDVEALFMGRLDTSKDPFYAELQGLEVSSHFFIRRTGEVVQFVSTLSRAWHAGVSSFEGRTNCNDFSCGIELEGNEKTPFTDEQYQALSTVVMLLAQRHPIQWVTGHEFIAPGRKIDPGPYFDWARFSQTLPKGLRVVTKPFAVP